MLDSAIKALTQMLTPPFRRVLLKSIGLGLILIVLVGVGLNRVFSWMATAGATWAETTVGGHTAWQIIAWVLSIAATLGIITGALFLMPAVTAFVGSFFVDEIADEVERTHYPMEPPGTALPLLRALVEGVKTALLAIVVYLVAVPFLFVAGLGLIIMLLANAYLLSREYFLLAAMRFRPPEEAKAMRQAHSGQIFFAGLPIVLFVSIPIVNLATPLFAMAMMVHLHKRLSQRRIEVQPPKRA
ncbi:MAG: sulfate transporter family protein [Alphaproteobacteria bacterium]|nr:sulfate transporter family protein [Alphaproteobacteria bacterium]